MSDLFQFRSASPTAPSREDREAMTVTALTAQIRSLLEGKFDAVWVKGEISNWTVAASGHAYFALKDAGALLSCVMWRSARERYAAGVKDGDSVEIRGKLSVYDKRGQYQLLADSLRPLGAGLLWQKFLELKEKLEKEGLFDPARKRPIPMLPRSVGIVTSPTGAAIRDILSVLDRRAPGLPIYIWPAKVQGEGAAREVVQGVKLLGASGLVDVLIVGRGGGSLEDLWEFNSEQLARAVVDCPVPVISAVGHEVDFSICDFAADLRAATPSAAAELVSGAQQEIASRVRDARSRLDRVIDRGIADARGRIRMALSSHALRAPEMRLAQAQQRADDAMRRLDLELDRQLLDLRHRVLKARGSLAGHNPALILKKGFGIVRDAATGAVIKSAEKVKKGRVLRTELSDGFVRSVVVEDADDLFE